MKFRKKPVIIEASQLTPKSREEISIWANEGKSGASANKSGLRAWYYDSNGDGELYIETLEGTMTASDGDWIIKGVKSEVYPCKDEIFRMTYEPADSLEKQVHPWTQKKNTMTIHDPTQIGCGGWKPQKADSERKELGPSDATPCSASSDVRRMVFAFDDKGRQDKVRRIAARVKNLEDALTAMHAHYRQWSIPAELFRQVESALGLPNASAMAAADKKTPTKE